MKHRDAIPRIEVPADSVRNGLRSRPTVKMEFASKFQVFEKLLMD